MDTEQKQRRIRFIVIVLSVLLTLSLVALGVVLVYDRVARTEPAYVVVPDNVIDAEAKKTEPSQQLPPPTVQTTTAAPTIPAPEETTSVALAAQTTEPHTQARASAPAENNSTTAASSAASAAKPTTVALHSKSPSYNQAFYAQNLLPGDSVAQRYCVRVSHDGDVTLRFRADVRKGGEVLAEVLKIKVVLEGTGQTLYDGLMRDMPAALTCKLPATSRTDSDVAYALTVYLDTSVGNRYQDRKLVADFRWWVEDGEPLVPPRTGDNASALLWICTATVALLAIALLLIILKRRQRHGK